MTEAEMATWTKPDSVHSVEMEIHTEAKSERKRSYHTGEFTVRTDTSDRKRYKDALAVQILDRLADSGIKPQMPIRGPVVLEVEFWRRKPKSYPKNPCKTNWWPEQWITRPDTENLLKPVKDVLTDIGFWEDDSQVVMETTQKKQGDQQKVVIRAYWDEQPEEDE